jgi:hypothetical protein
MVHSLRVADRKGLGLLAERHSKKFLVKSMTQLRFITETNTCLHLHSSSNNKFFFTSGNKDNSGIWKTKVNGTYLCITLINRGLFPGSGYELYDPFSGNVTVVVGPAPHYGGPGGCPPVLAAVPCQPLPLQPLEWFNPAFLPYVTAPCHNGLASSRDRRKRYSTDSQVLHISSLGFRTRGYKIRLCRFGCISSFLLWMRFRE